MSSVTATCAKCGASYNLADTMEGKTVRCKKCQTPFVVKPSSRSAESRIKASAARPAKGGPPPLDDEDEHEDDEDEAPAPPKKKSSMGLILGIVGGVAALLFLLCGGGALLLWYAAYSGVHAVKHGIEDEIANHGGDIQIPGPNGGNPKAQGINNAADAVAALKGGEKARQDAAVTWLNKNPLDPAKQKDVARALDPLVEKTTDWTKGEVLKAVGTWGDKDSVPGLVKICNNDKSPFVDGYTKQCWKAFVRIKDERGAEATVPFLPNFFAGDEAKQALIDMGAAAGEKAVLKALNNPDGSAHDRARAVLKGYGTKDDALIHQTALDVKDLDAGRRRVALDYLNQTPAIAPLKGEVRPALEGCLTDKEGDIQDRAFKALVTWGGSDSVPALVKLVETSSLEEHIQWARSKAMDALGKIKDPQAVRPLVMRLNNPQDRGPASGALQAMGPLAEDQLKGFIATETNDKDGRSEAANILKKIGSKENVGLISALTDLKGTDVGRRRDAAGALVKLPVDAAKQGDVRLALETCLDDLDVQTREQAARALSVWGDKDSVAVVLKALDEAGQPDGVRHACIETLGKLKDEKAAEKLTLRLLVQQDRQRAGKALEDIGPKVEPEVIKALGANDKEACKEACRVLEKVGSKASLTPLATLWANAVKAKDVQNAAKNAGDAIKARGN